MPVTQILGAMAENKHRNCLCGTPDWSRAACAELAIKANDAQDKGGEGTVGLVWVSSGLDTRCFRCLEQACVGRVGPFKRRG